MAGPAVLLAPGFWLLAPFSIPRLAQQDQRSIFAMSLAVSVTVGNAAAIPRARNGSKPARVADRAVASSARRAAVASLLRALHTRLQANFGPAAPQAFRRRRFRA